MESPFRSPLPPGLKLIETFGRQGGAFVRLPAHLARLERTAAALGVPFDRAAVARALATLPADRPLRVRLTLDAEGTPTVETAPLPPSPTLWTVAVHPARLDPDDPWLRVKTTERRLYDRARASLPAGIDEWVFLNTRGEVCEGTITTLFLRRDGIVLTPPLSSGLLPGVLRQELLDHGAREAVLTLGDLAAGDLLVGNSLRGIAPARLAPEAHRAG